MRWKITPFNHWESHFAIVFFCGDTEQKILPGIGNSGIGQRSKECGINFIKMFLLSAPGPFNPGGGGEGGLPALTLWDFHYIPQNRTRGILGPLNGFSSREKAWKRGLVGHSENSKIIFCDKRYKTGLCGSIKTPQNTYNMVCLYVCVCQLMEAGMLGWVCNCVYVTNFLCAHFKFKQKNLVETKDFSPIPAGA